MAQTRSSDLLRKVEELARSSRDEAEARIGEVFADGVVTRSEAEALFLLSPRYSRKNSIWDARMTEAVCDYVLNTEAPQNWVSDEEADWLIGLVSARGDGLLALDIDVLLALLRKADGAPPRLGIFVLDLCCKRIRAKGMATAEDVERVRRAIYSGSGDGGLWVTRREAVLMFETNDAVAHARNAPEWNDLFARTIGNHLLAAAHPDPMSEAEALAREAWIKRPDGGVFAGFASLLGTTNWFERLTYDPRKAAEAREVARRVALKKAEAVTQDESAWLMKRLGWDGKVSPAERALVDFLRREAPGFADGLIIAA